MKKTFFVCIVAILLLSSCMTGLVGSGSKYKPPIQENHMVDTNGIHYGINYNGH